MASQMAQNISALFLPILCNFACFFFICYFNPIDFFRIFLIDKQGPDALAVCRARQGLPVGELTNLIISQLLGAIEYQTWI